MTLFGITVRRGNGAYTIKRAGDPVLDARGIWQAGLVVELRGVNLGIWPVDKSVLPLPEGRRAEHTITIHSEIELIVDDGVRDRVLYDDGTGEAEFEVWSCLRYTNHEGFTIYEAQATKQAAGT